MYHLICFDRESQYGDLRYPLPLSLDLAILDGDLNLIEKRMFLFQRLANYSQDELLKCWKVVLDDVIGIISMYDKRFLVFQTHDHQQLFHIVKKKCNLKTKASASGDLGKLTTIYDSLFTEKPQKISAIDKMIAIATDLGNAFSPSNPDIFPVTLKKDPRESIAACSSYFYIADTRNNHYHKKDSICLEKIPIEFWRGIGKNPLKNGFITCPICLGKKSEPSASLVHQKNENAMSSGERRLIDGNYAVSSNIIARCHMIHHRGYLTKNLVKKHECLSKSCYHFQKLKPDYWEAVRRSEQSRKNSSIEHKEAKKQRYDRDIFIRETLEDNGCTYVTSIREERGLLVISYIFDRKVDLMPEIQYLRRVLRTVVKLKAVKTSDDILEQLIRKPRREMRNVTDVRKAPKVGIAAKIRLEALGVYCLEDLFGRNGDALYALDCKLSGTTVNRRYLYAYNSAVEYANSMELPFDNRNVDC